MNEVERRLEGCSKLISGQGNKSLSWDGLPIHKSLEGMIDELKGALKKYIYDLFINHPHISVDSHYWIIRCQSWYNHKPFYNNIELGF